MANQHLFEALQNICNFTALQTDMQEILNAVKKDRENENKITNILTEERRLVGQKLINANIEYPHYEKYVKHLKSILSEIELKLEIID